MRLTVGGALACCWSKIPQTGPSKWARITTLQKPIARWALTASVTIAVRDISSSAVVANARVSGTFNPGGSYSCLTTSAGTCVVTSAAIALTTTTTRFSVTGVTGTNLVYDASQNSATQITISK